MVRALCYIGIVTKYHRCMFNKSFSTPVFMAVDQSYGILGYSSQTVSGVVFRGGPAQFNGALVENFSKFLQ